MQKLVFCNQTDTTFNWRKIRICCYRMPFFKFKMLEIRSWPGHHPGPHRGCLQRSPRPSSRISGVRD